MNDIGEYGRTNKGKIFKFCWVENEKYILVLTDSTYYVGVKSFEKYWLDEDEKIVKHSPNIIDLIEVGDYVNGYKILSVEKEYYNLNLDEVLPLNIPKLVVGNEEGILSINEIISIVTKEQFASMEYELEGSK